MFFLQLGEDFLDEIDGCIYIRCVVHVAGEDQVVGLWHLIMAEFGEIHAVGNHHNLFSHRMMDAVSVQGGNHGFLFEIVEDIGFVVGDAVRLHPHDGSEERKSLLCPTFHPHGESILIVKHFRNPAVAHIFRHPE